MAWYSRSEMCTERKQEKKKKRKKKNVRWAVFYAVYFGSGTFLPVKKKFYVMKILLPGQSVYRIHRE